MAHHKHKYLLLALLLITITVFAQPKAIVEHYSTDDGLSHVAVNCIIKDQQGFMWFSTWNGINRFDGSRFISYKSVPGDRSPLKNDRIDAIVDGDVDHLWLKSYDSQIYSFNKASGKISPLNTVFPAAIRAKLKFKNVLASNDGQLWLESAGLGIFYFPDAYNTPANYTRYYSGRNADRWIASNDINFFHIDHNQNVWIGTAGGLTLLKKERDSFQPASQVVKNDPVTDITEGDRFLYTVSAGGQLYVTDKHTGHTIVKRIANSRINNTLISRKRDVLYASGSDGDLFECDLQNFAVRKIAKASAEIFTLFEDSKGSLWIEPAKEGVLRYDPQSGALKFYSQLTDANSRFIGNHYQVFEDKNGLVWIAMKKGGFGYYDTAKDQVLYFFDDPNDPNRKFSNNVAHWYYDPAGVLWLVTNEHELEKVVFQQSNFQQYKLETHGRFKSENDVRGLAVDRKGRIWVGTKGNKLYVLQNGNKLSNVFTNEPASGLGQVYTITPDSGGAVWMGTKSNGLYKAEPVNADGTTYKLIHYQADDNDKHSISSNQIYTVLQDSRGRIWAGSFDGGLNLFVSNGGAAHFVRQADLLKGVPQGAFNKIRKMSLDGAGNIWVATTDGIMVIQAQSDQLPFRAKTYSKVAGDITSLGSNDVQYVYRDDKNTMWLGTSGGGLSKAMGNDPLNSLKFQNYTSRDGLFNDYIVSLASDADDNLWLASQTGLTRFNPSSGEFRTYDSSDGIPRTVFSESACIKMPQSGIVFGTMSGLLSFDPEQLTDQRIFGRIVFTNVQVNNQDIALLDNSSLLAHQVNELESLQLKYDQSTVSFDYTVLDYRSGNKQNYMFRLAGFDTVWRSSRGFQRTTYTNLPPGQYKFEMKCVSPGLYTNTPYRSLIINILPPPWLTWWAYLLYFAVAVVIFVLIRKNTLTMLRLRQSIAVEQHIATLKTTFFTNISHELRTPLTLIINPITAIAETENLSENGKEYISIVQKNASRIMRFINQLLDLRKVQSGKAVMNYQQIELIGFIKDVGSYFAEIAKEKNISQTLNSNVNEITCRIDPEKIDIVLYNILANAYKFSPPGKHIDIDVYAKDEIIKILISDEAGGVPPDNLNDLFKLFYEGDHHHQKGSGIGLALSKEMIALHEGKIWADNNYKGGLTISIELKNINVVAAPVIAPVEPALATEMTLDEAIADVVEHMEEHTGKEQILLVEDNADLRAFLRLQIDNKYRLETAEDGIKGLEQARKLLPDLIISDIMMPGMDGITMLEQLKNDETTSHIPVILLSAKQAVEDQIQGLRYGADAYITKPFNNNFLIATIDNIIAKRKLYFQSITGEKQAMDISPSPVVITSHDESFLKKLIGIVEGGMPDPDFNIDAVAALMNMSRSPFYKKIKSLTGLAPVEFIREMRLKRARQYMDAGETVVSDIACKVGFYNVKYFSTCFKDKFEKSPSDYIKGIHELSMDSTRPY
ncbi:response regulator [Mucilaginibacter mali]|uniref:histidine kinase n=1 Tax=Mucilaginibacter mali TaxID=2740462 RepID=A0A7D4QAB3_9SPHI|nr:two-component regulator propeller domain-containing protein [Mucilaginibacter mali]QKJ30685.1 response regulator [Mucilaginibacter mali]